METRVQSFQTMHHILFQILGSDSSAESYAALEPFNIVLEQNFTALWASKLFYIFRSHCSTKVIFSWK